MYASYALDDPPGIYDATVRISAPSALRHHFRPMVRVWANGQPLFEPTPLDRAFTALESSLNWSVAAVEFAPLVIHSAAVERDGCALIMPAPSGSGKSTLSAALALRGWRLLSDEMAVFPFEDERIHPNPRPVSLKNEAIDLIGDFEPSALLTRTYRGTPKGNVAYMRVPGTAISRAHEPAVPRLVIVPNFRKGEPAKLSALDKAEGFHWLVESSVNYASKLRSGFDTIARIVEQCEMFTFTYSDLGEAVAVIDRLHREIALKDRSV
jgi:HprK-related kinase A